MPALQTLGGDHGFRVRVGTGRRLETGGLRTNEENSGGVVIAVLPAQDLSDSFVAIVAATILLLNAIIPDYSRVGLLSAFCG
jgi:hypothetical protein